MVRPVQQAAEVVPLVQAAHPHAVTHAKGHAVSNFDVVRHEQRLPIADVDYEALVAGAVLIVRQKAADEARDFNPPPVFGLAVANISPPLPAPS